MKNLFSLLLFILSCNLFSDGQSVSISATPSPADSSAILDIRSNSKGMLVPRMTSADRIAIKNPAQGLLLFDTDLKVLFLFDSTNWVALNQSTIATVEITVKDGNSWSVSNPSLSVSVGATVNLYETQEDLANNTARYTAITKQSGIAIIRVQEGGYFVIVQKGNAKNIFNGYLIGSIFQSQEEINSSPPQTPAAVVGGPRYADANSDGVITSLDQVNSDFINPLSIQNTAKTVIIYQ